MTSENGSLQCAESAGMGLLCKGPLLFSLTETNHRMGANQADPIVLRGKRWYGYYRNRSSIHDDNVRAIRIIVRLGLDWRQMAQSTWEACAKLLFMVGTAGFEPTTSTV